jgi:PAS domain S-box-containing protein
MGAAGGHEVLDWMTEGFQIIDRDWRYVYLNDAAARHAQRAKDQLLGRTMMDCYPGIESTEVFGRLQRCMETRQPQSMENEFTYPDGSTRWFALKIQAAPEGVSVLSMDLTERRRAEEAVRLSEEKLRAAFEHAATGMALVGSGGRCLRVNPALCRLVGYAEDELVSMTLRDITHPDELENGRDFIKELLAGEQLTYARERRCLHKSGEVVWVAWSVSQVRDAAGDPLYFVCQLQDLTGRKLAEEKQAKAEEALHRSQKLEAIGRLAGGVAHDFNNVLGVITGHGELARKEIPEGHPSRRRLEHMLKAAERAAGLTRQLLAFSRKQVQEPRLLDLNAVAADLESMFERILGEDIETEIRPARDLGLCSADPTQVEQVLLNLIVNARDAMPKGGRLTIETANAEFDDEYAAAHPPALPGRFVMLAISDSGTGMDAETQQRAFEPFFTTKPRGEGTGLGLATVYGIVKQSGGYIWLYSEPGRGTTFKIYLPRVDEASPGSLVTAPSSALPAPHGHETLLLVEDSAALRDMILEVLLQHGYQVLHAGNGEQALEVLRKHKGAVDLLLTDVVMPRLGGKDLADAVRVLHPAIRVVYMSGYTDGAISRAGILGEGVALLEKPFTSDRLTRAVREALDQTEPDTLK